VGVLRATIDSGERELQIVLGQDTIASPAGEFEVEQVR
jgi:pyridoxine kinase